MKAMMNEDESFVRKQKITLYLEEVAKKEKIEIKQVIFQNKKIIPNISLLKPYTIKFPDEFLNDMNDGEIEAIGLHEVGHHINYNYAKQVGVFALEIIVLAIALIEVLKFLGLNPWLYIPIIIPCFPLFFYSLRWFEYKADAYAKSVIGKNHIINGLEKFRVYGKQREFNTLHKKIVRAIFPMHPPIDSRKKRLDKFWIKKRRSLSR